MSANIYLARLEAVLGPRYSPHTRRNSLRHAEQFLSLVGMKAEYTRPELLAYLDKLVRQEYGESSIHVIVAGVKAMFTANGLDWPLTHQDMHLGLPQEETHCPILSPSEVGLLIAYGLTQQHPVRTVIALATIYGLRTQELLEAIRNGCDGEVLSIQTAKSGRLREHTIPEYLRPVLTFKGWPVSRTHINVMYERSMGAAVRVLQVRRKREGWHSVRRSVVTALYRAEIAEVIIHQWMGWRDSRTISRRYYRPEPGEIDAKVFAKHPYARLWLPKGE